MSPQTSLLGAQNHTIGFCPHLLSSVASSLPYKLPNDGSSLVPITPEDPGRREGVSEGCGDALPYCWTHKRLWSPDLHEKIQF